MLCYVIIHVVPCFLANAFYSLFDNLPIVVLIRVSHCTSLTCVRVNYVFWYNSRFSCHLNFLIQVFVYSNES